MSDSRYVESPANECGRRGGSPLQNTHQNIVRGPEIAAVPSGPPESQCLLLPGDWKSVDQEKLNIQIKTKSTNQVIYSLCLLHDVKKKASLETSVAITRHEVFTSGPGYGLTPFPLNPETLSHSLKFTWKPVSNAEGNARVGLHNGTGGQHLPWRGIASN